MFRASGCKICKINPLPLYQPSQQEQGFLFELQTFHPRSNQALQN